MRVLQLEALSGTERARLCHRAPAFDPELRARVRGILQDVRARGDAALLEYAERFDGVKLRGLRVPPSQIRRALDEIPPELRAALEAVKAHLERFHEPQRPQGYRSSPCPGVALERRVRPHRRVGLYVPRSLPSSLLMAGVPARLAGVSELVVCTPPQADGSVPAAIQAAAALLGVEELYAVGGAQAIGALAYGTASIPPVEKITGPGNAYVTAAKALVRDDVGIDLLAGPSEVLLWVEPLPGFSLEALIRWAAAELRAQLEHGPGTAALLLTPSAELAARVARALMPSDVEGRQVAVLVYRDREAAVEFVNDYAPEHLALWLPDEELDGVLDRVENAGSVFLGPWTPVALGDYAAGTNHILPTAGGARFASGLGVEAFCKAIAVQRVRPEGLRALAPTAIALAEAEGLPAHAESVRLRLREGEGSPR